MTSTPQELASKDINTWINFIRNAEIPVLKHTAREVARLKEDEDNQSARAISTAVLNDPMMIFRVLSFAQNHRAKKQLQDLAQADQAILMMGTTSFFTYLSPKILVEDMLKSNLPALMNLLKLVRRAHQAAHFAADWATHLADLHAEEVRTAALLHDLSEMLMWCFAPDKMNAIYALQQADKSLRSAAAQEEVLGFKLLDLQKELVAAFQLPPLLSKLMQDSASSEQRVRNVTLAVNLARHSANGWDDAALPDDYRDIAELLRMDVAKVMRIVGTPATAATNIP
ncbi:MAG: HDOD domain-containing protein [Methylotenera sp.]|uniref:HDOD domain-containing protein n=1 Tax=Methylotenera sp. TaxID=2051956 RepID=UPI002488C687|nr:HDOD domain-containing protein [Methylotenera sp.]MDI1309391.1 HDOD domain-containing protein [Methylotenera sp.]